MTSQNKQLRNEVGTKKELNERMNNPSESIMYSKDLMKSVKKIGDTIGFGYNSTTKKGESSKSREMKNTKGKPTCHFVVRKVIQLMFTGARMGNKSLNTK